MSRGVSHHGLLHYENASMPDAVPGDLGTGNWDLLVDRWNVESGSVDYAHSTYTSQAHIYYIWYTLYSTQYCIDETADTGCATDTLLFSLLSDL